MKKTGKVVCLVFVLILLSKDSNADQSNNNRQNLSYLKFEGFDPKLQAKHSWVSPVSQRLPNPGSRWIEMEIKLWEDAIKQAAVMFPKSFFKKIKHKVTFTFLIDQNAWSTAFVDGWSRVYINLLPSREKLSWMTWEPLAMNGFSKIERLFVALHEIAHVYSLGSELNNLYFTTKQYYGLIEWSESMGKPAVAPLVFYEDYELKDCCEDFSDRETFLGHYIQFYGFAQFVENSSQPVIDLGNLKVRQWHIHDSFTVKKVSIAKELSPTLYGVHGGQVEDFAETLTLYIMWPEHLKANHPLHYKMAQKILVRKYRAVYPVPSFINSRLTVGDHVPSR